ncbi:hypothetical protein HHI36_019847, partial [Cryptolaemus montrouzieri]
TRCNTKKKFTLSPEVKYLKTILDRIYEVAKSRPEFKTLYSKLKKKYDLAISAERRAYFGHVINSAQSKSRATWKVAVSLAYIMNLFFKDGVYPDELKIAIVKPLHKKGDVN